MSKSPETTIREEIRALTAYHVADSEGFIKLDAMENPYDLPSELGKEIAERVAKQALNRYPDAAALSLKQRLRDAMQIPTDCELILGNGSDELIQVLAMSVARPDATLLSVEPSFVMYRMIAAFTNMRYAGVALRENFQLDVDVVLRAIRNTQPPVIFIAYPNNPTGNLFNAEDIVKIIRAAPGMVVVDEAYHVFAEASFLPRIKEFSNLLVMRTLSKLGLAGLRLGFVVGDKSWIQQLDKLRLPYNINVLTQVVADVVLARQTILLEQAEQIKQQRSRLYSQLQNIKVIEPYPSAANFILFKVQQAGAVFEMLKQQKILIKNLNGSHPLLADCLRVTVGTPEQNEQFIQALYHSLNVLKIAY